MEVFIEGYKMLSSDHEPVDFRRDTLGVSFLASTWSSPAYYLSLVRSPIGFQRSNTKIPKESSRNMDPLLDSA